MKSDIQDLRRIYKMNKGSSSTDFQSPENQSLNVYVRNKSTNASEDYKGLMHRRSLSNQLYLKNRSFLKSKDTN